MAPTFEEAWPVLLRKAAIDEFTAKLIAKLENNRPGEKYFTSEEYMGFYTIVYNAVCANDRRYNAPQEAKFEKIYYIYRRAFVDYLSSKVLPSLEEKESENLLRELLRRWNNHKIMTRLLSGIFNYLSRYYIPSMGLPSLERTSYLAFYHGVCFEIKDQVSDAIISLINREREGEKIDRTVVKQVLDQEIGEDTWQSYAKRTETVLHIIHDKIIRSLGESDTKFYEDFVLKVEKLFEEEETRSVEYLMLKHKDKFLKVHRRIKIRLCADMQALIEREADPIKMSMLAIEERKDTGYRIKRASSEKLREIVDEIGNGDMKMYANDIDQRLIEATALFYSKKALDWMASFSYKDYMFKVEECLEEEKNRALEYLLIINEDKLLEVVRYELLHAHAKKLEQKKAASEFIVAKIMKCILIPIQLLVGFRRDNSIKSFQ